MHQLFDEDPSSHDGDDDGLDDIPDFRAFTFYLADHPAGNVWSAPWAVPDWYSVAWDGLFERVMAKIHAEEQMRKDQRMPTKAEPPDPLPEEPVNQESLAEILGGDMQAVGALSVMRASAQDYGHWRDDRGYLTERELRRVDYQIWLRQQEQQQQRTGANAPHDE